MEQTARLMKIAVHQSEGGMFFATSESEPSFFLSALSITDLCELLPIAIQDMFQSRDGIDMMAFPTNVGHIGDGSWVVIPDALIAATRLGRS